MNRNDAMHKILNFGAAEQRNFLTAGKTQEAYQIEHARNSLIYCLNGGTIKAVRERLERMTNYTVAANGFWQYDAFSFVFDDFTRDLLVIFKNNF